MKRKAVTIVCMIFCIFFTGCSHSPASSFEPTKKTDFEIINSICNAEGYYVGRIESKGELERYGIYLMGEYGSYRLITEVGSEPHVQGYQGKIYYIESGSLFSIEQEAPSKPISLTPDDPVYHEKGYLLESTEKITDGWIYLKASKLGKNESGLSVHVPVWIAIRINESQWKEIEQDDIP